jgi:hypothetical protein
MFLDRLDRLLQTIENQTTKIVIVKNNNQRVEREKCNMCLVPIAPSITFLGVGTGNVDVAGRPCNLQAVVLA